MKLKIFFIVCCLGSIHTQTFGADDMDPASRNDPVAIQQRDALVKFCKISFAAGCVVGYVNFMRRASLHLEDMPFKKFVKTYPGLAIIGMSGFVTTGYAAKELFESQYGKKMRDM